MIPLEVIKFIWNHPANQGRRLRTVLRAIRWKCHRLMRDTPRLVPIFHGMQLKCYPSSYGAGVMIATNGWPDYDEMHFIQRYLRPGDAFVDIGTNIGIFTLFSSGIVGPSGYVLGLEANRRSFDRLIENIQLNDLNNIVDARCEAVGPENGTIRFLKGRDLTNRIVTDAEQGKAGVEFDEVPCVRIDSLLSQRNFAMGKIDIEGAEPMAFRGATQALQIGNPPVWMMELKSHLLTRFDSSPEKVRDMLLEFDYRLATYDANQNRLTFSEQPWEGHGDVLAIHFPSLPEIQSRLDQSSA